MSVRYYGGLSTGLGNDAGVLAGSPSFQIGPRIGGNYNVQDQTGQLNLGYQTPMFGFGVGITRTPGTPAVSPGYGFQGNVQGRF